MVSGDEEYRSEEALPQLGKILSEHHGFKCTVLFPIDPKTGEINPDNYWAQYVYDAVRTYSPWIKVWEIWNEPDYVSEWQVTQEWPERAPTSEDLIRFNGSVYDYVVFDDGSGPALYFGGNFDRAYHGPQNGDVQQNSIFAGNTVPDGATPIAQAYAGHQFGSLTPQLGDGRAIALGDAGSVKAAPGVGPASPPAPSDDRQLPPRSLSNRALSSSIDAPSPWAVVGHGKPTP